VDSASAAVVAAVRAAAVGSGAARAESVIHIKRMLVGAAFLGAVFGLLLVLGAISEWMKPLYAQIDWQTVAGVAALLASVYAFGWFLLSEGEQERRP
jgi:hypothetical protein